MLALVPRMSVLYEDDLAFIHARGFGELAVAAATSLIPELRARGARRVIDLGCGAGASTRVLADAGFDTVAIDPSAALLELARAAAPAARFERASAYEVALDSCDAILAVGEALTYHDPSDDADGRLRELFQRSARALSERGLMVFDLIETGGHPLDARVWRAGSDWAVLSSSREDAEGRRLTREIETFRDAERGGTYRRRREVHHLRLFERHAVTSWLKDAGFEVVTADRYGSFQLPRRRVAFYAVRR